MSVPVLNGNPSHEMFLFSKNPVFEVSSLFQNKAFLKPLLQTCHCLKFKVEFDLQKMVLVESAFVST